MNTDITEQYLSSLDLDRCAAQNPLAFIKALQSRHVATHSFNSIAVLCGQQIDLDLPHLSEKIVQDRQGGYCFEHNKLVYEVLKDLGFSVERRLARVVYNRDVDVPLTHRITLLRFEGERYIVDTGFGHLGARFPVKMTIDEPQEQARETFRVHLAEDGQYHYQIHKDGDFFTLYTFRDIPYSEADCDMGNFYSYKHPTAAFVNNLVVCRKFADRIDSLRNGEVYQIFADGTQVTKIESAQHMWELLTQMFEIPLELAVAEFLFDKFAVKKAG